MNKLIESIELAKELYKYGVVHENNLIEDKSLSLITNLTLIQEMFSVETSSNSNNNIENEIERVKRKVPKWLGKEQYNSRILFAYIKLSNFNQLPVKFSDLMNFTEIDEKTFLGHYNGMKIITKKNHAKVFEEENKIITLWEPVADFILSLYLEDDFKVWVKEEGGMSKDYVVESYIKALKKSIPKHLEEYENSTQYENLFLSKNINFLEQLRKKYLKDGEWENITSNTILPSSLKKYIDFLESNIYKVED